MFWLNPVDRYHLELADENHLKVKIMLYYLCLSKPLKNLKDLPTHEAEYDMIEKGNAQKEREEHDRKLKEAQELLAKKNAILRRQEREEKKNKRAQLEAKSRSPPRKHSGTMKDEISESGKEWRYNRDPKNRQERKGEKTEKELAKFHDIKHSSSKLSLGKARTSIGTLAKAKSTVALLPQVDPKIVAKKGKEWWEKYNFSNTVLFRYKFDITSFDMARSNSKSKNPQGAKPEAGDFLVPEINLVLLYLFSQHLGTDPSIQYWE